MNNVRDFITIQHGRFLPVVEATGFGEVRRLAASFAERIGLSETESGNLNIIVNEIGTNLVKHARSGAMLARVLEFQDCLAVEILAIDGGPGIQEIGRAMRDGYSTTGTTGSGLGSIARLATVFDIYSEQGKGTLIVAQVWSGGRVAPSSTQISGIAIPLAGEEFNGDAWIASSSPRSIDLLVADGLGHGPDAAAAANAAVAAFRQDLESSEGQEARFRPLQDALTNTRGAAIAIATISRESNELSFSAMGNISGAIVTREKQSGLLGLNGIVGLDRRQVPPQTHKFPKGALLVLHSDGIGSRWKLGNHRGIAFKHPSIIASLIFRDHQRGTDDASILVLKADLPPVDAPATLS